MTFSQIAAKIAADVSNILNAALQERQSATVQPLLTPKAAAGYGRSLDAGNIALRVLIVASEEMPGDLGRMELFVPVSKKQLKRDPGVALGSVLRFIYTAVNYRTETIGKVRERAEA